MLKTLLKETEAKMLHAVFACEHQLNTIRTGRASINLLDGIQVEAYGSKVPIKQVASLSTPDAQSIVIQPWDKSIAGNIEKSILASDLGITPVNDGRVIRLNIPPLTEERRKEYVKIAKHMTEEGRISVRNIRRHYNDEIKKMEKEHTISEDEAYTDKDRIQEITDSHTNQVNNLLEAKEQEIMEV